MNLPNKLTLLRIILIPIFVFFVSFGAIPMNYLMAVLVFSFASFTDYLDGAIARKEGLVTDFGKFADPLADKILTTTAFIYMMMDGVCHPVVLVLVLAREFAVSGVRMVAAGSKENNVIAANIWGKAKTALQMLCIIVYYAMMALRQISGQAPILPQGGAAWLIIWLLCWLVAVATVLSGWQYIWQNRQYIKEC